MSQHSELAKEEPGVEVESPASSELADDDLENVAGGAVSCTPDQPTILPADDFLTPITPSL